ncbi:MAG: hypothetical protein AAF810_13935, partial [Cyanobacteria bacterium P01_D01_bin.36]
MWGGAPKTEKKIHQVKKKFNAEAGKTFRTTTKTPLNHPNNQISCIFLKNFSSFHCMMTASFGV